MTVYNKLVCQRQTNISHCRSKEEKDSTETARSVELPIPMIGAFSWQGLDPVKLAYNTRCHKAAHLSSSQGVKYSIQTSLQTHAWK